MNWTFKLFSGAIKVFGFSEIFYHKLMNFNTNTVKNIVCINSALK